VSKFNLSFDILGNDKTASKALKGVGQQAGKTNTAMSKLSKVGMAGVAAGAAAAAAGVAVLATQLAEGVQFAIADQKAQKLLATALKNTTGATDAQVKAAEEWIDTTQRATGVADDELRPALATLARATGDVGDAQGLLATAMDVAAGTGKPLETVSLALAKAYNGQTGALARLGLNMKDSDGKAVSFEVAMQRLNKQFGGTAAANAETYEGKTKRIGIIFDELKESIGAKLLPALEDFADWLITTGVPTIENWLRVFEEDIVPFLEEKLGPVIGDIKESFKSLSTEVDKNRDTFDTLGKILGPLATISLFNLGASIKVVTYLLKVGLAVVGQYAAAFRNVKGALDNVGIAFGEFIVKIRNLPDRIRAASAGMFGGLVSAFRSAVNSIIAIWNGLRLTWPSFNGDWNGPLPGGEFSVGGWTIDTPNIPYLAKGGIVTRPTLAMIGEAGPEAVIPLSRAGVGGPSVVVNVHNAVVGNEQQLARTVLSALRQAGAVGAVRIA